MYYPYLKIIKIGKQNFKILVKFNTFLIQYSQHQICVQYYHCFRYNAKLFDFYIFHEI